MKYFRKKEFQNLAPIFDQGFKNTVEKTIITVENLLNKAEFLSRHVAYNQELSFHTKI
jgi:hypothetical protein